jgi:hypothetical protein
MALSCHCRKRFRAHRADQLFRHLHPKGVPDDVIATVGKLGESVSRSEAVKKYATFRGALFALRRERPRRKRYFRRFKPTPGCYSIRRQGLPDTVGIPRP